MNEITSSASILSVQNVEWHCGVVISRPAVRMGSRSFTFSKLSSGADKKYHVEHFTCSLCPTLFGPHDSYYEHDGDVFCHFHYSTRFATKCVGCNSAILKQFVEINRNSRDECWHPECYMINKVRSFQCTPRPTDDGSPVLECQSLFSSADKHNFA